MALRRPCGPSDVALWVSLRHSAGHQLSRLQTFVMSGQAEVQMRLLSCGLARGHDFGSLSQHEAVFSASLRKFLTCLRPFDMQARCDVASHRRGVSTYQSGASCCRVSMTNDVRSPTSAILYPGDPKPKKSPVSTGPPKSSFPSTVSLCRLGRSLAYCRMLRCPGAGVAQSCAVQAGLVCKGCRPV